jgi:hypothetical protein
MLRLVLAGVGGPVGNSSIDFGSCLLSPNFNKITFKFLLEHFYTFFQADKPTPRTSYLDVFSSSFIHRHIKIPQQQMKFAKWRAFIRNPPTRGLEVHLLWLLVVVVECSGLWFDLLFSLTPRNAAANIGYFT